tara:strand:- start:2003 stop:2173 length:171 start_codon:yes stop_codon:yes gene_type:complete
MGLKSIDINPSSIEEILDGVDSYAAFEIGRMICLVDLLNQFFVKPDIKWIAKPENN